MIRKWRNRHCDGHCEGHVVSLNTWDLNLWIECDIYYPSRQKTFVMKGISLRKGKNIYFKLFVSLRRGNIYLIVSFLFLGFFSFGKLIFKIFLGHFSIKSAPFFPRKNRKTWISAEILPFRRRFQNWKWILERSFNYFIYPTRS